MPVICRMIAMLVLAAALAMPAFAADDDPGRVVIRERLFERLAAAGTMEDGRRAEDDVWTFWTEPPDRDIREAIARGMRQRDSYDWDAALETFTQVIDQAPNYAEGWNQRAFIHFLKEDYEASLADLEQALEHEPKHFGALTGKALILMRMDRFDEGQAILREAVAIHPFLAERGMLVPPSP